MTLASLETRTIDHNITVLFCGVPIASFHEISDDYAHTHAGDFKNLFTTAWFSEGKDRLPMDERVKACVNEAYSKLP